MNSEKLSDRYETEGGRERERERERLLLEPLISPFTAPACQISGLTDAPASSVFSGPITHLLSMLYVLIKNSFHMPLQAKRRRKGLRVSNFALIIFR